MRWIAIAAIMALGLTACGDAPSANDEGAEQMAELPSIRDLWNFQDPAASEAAFRALAAEAEAAGNDAYAAEAMTQVARTFSLRGEFDQANAILDVVDEGPHGSVPVVRVRSLLERGRTLNSGGQPDAALPLFEEAYEIAVASSEDFLAGDAIHMAGIAADIEGERQWVGVLREFVEGEPDNPATYWFGAMHNNLGWSYMSAERFEEALTEFQASRDAYAAMEGKRYETLIADYSVGQAMRRLGRCEAALPLQEQTFEAIRTEFDTEDEYVAEEIALCRAALGDTEGARDPAALAYDKFSAQSWFVESEADRLEALRELAER